jgi:hypothetical protein
MELDTSIVSINAVSQAHAGLVARQDAKTRAFIALSVRVK